MTNAMLERFWSKVEKSGACWEWTGSTNRHGGYGRFRCGKGNRIVAHRFAWELENGPLAPGAVVAHLCDNPPCVRASHLFVTDQAGNMRDAATKGRMFRAQGVKNYNAKLTPVQVREIRRTNNTQEETARLFKVSQACISAVITGRTWSHVD